MTIFPLISMVEKSPASKSLAVIEGLILVPLVAVLLSFVLAKTPIPFGIRMAIVFLVSIPLTGAYARYASS